MPHQEQSAVDLRLPLRRIQVCDRGIPVEMQAGIQAGIQAGTQAGIQVNENPPDVLSVCGDHLKIRGDDVDWHQADAERGFPSGGGEFQPQWSVAILLQSVDERLFPIGDAGFLTQPDREPCLQPEDGSLLLKRVDSLILPKRDLFPR